MSCRIRERESQMNNFTIVRTEHLNHHGNLFGGAMLGWVDEFAWLVASRDFPDCTLVTIAMDNIAFRHRVSNGSILRFAIDHAGQGNTSVSYSVDVYANAPGTTAEQHVFSTQITFVRVDPQGGKLALPTPTVLRSQS